MYVNFMRKPAELIALGETLALSVPDAVKVLERGGFSASVAVDWQRTRAIAVKSVPILVYKNRMQGGIQHFSK